MQIGIGNIGGIIGSNIYLAAQAMLWLCALMCTVFYFGLMRENMIRDRGGRDERLALAQEVENLGDNHAELRFSG